MGGEGSPFLELPDLEDADYIVEWWHEAGTISQGGMGISPLTWQEIRAWRLENELHLENFELQMIRAMSSEYCGEYNAGSEKGREAPYSVSEEKVDRVAISNKIGNVLSGFKRNTDAPKYTVED